MLQTSSLHHLRLVVYPITIPGSHQQEEWSQMFFSPLLQFFSAELILHSVRPRLRRHEIQTDLAHHVATILTASTIRLLNLDPYHIESYLTSLTSRVHYFIHSKYFQLWLGKNIRHAVDSSLSSRCFEWRPRTKEIPGLFGFGRMPGEKPMPQIWKDFRGGHWVRRPNDRSWVDT